MNFEELVAGVSKHHGAFVGRIEGQKLLQVGDASSGAFAEWFRRRGREVHVDGKDKDYDAAYSQGSMAGMREKKIVKLVEKVLKRAPVFVFSVPTKLWRYANIKRTAADYERILDGYEVETFPYWGGKMLCVVIKPIKKKVVKKESIKKTIEKEATKKTNEKKSTKKESEGDSLKWKRK